MKDVPVLTVHNLSVALPAGSGRKYAVRNLNMSVTRGEIVCVVGESGSGKSVLSEAIMGALPPQLPVSAGQILFQGRNIVEMDEENLRAMRGNTIAMIFQEPMSALNPSICIGQQIIEVLSIHRPEMTTEQKKARVLKLLNDVNLPDPEGIGARLPHELSGGQCQRVVIAMALALDPVLLIADEPTTALDATTQAQILNLICELRDHHNHAIIFITHDLGVVADIADRVVVMKSGQIIEQGGADDVLYNPREAYTRGLLDALPQGKVPEQMPPPAQHYPAISVRKLSKYYGHYKALDSISFDLQPGQSLVVVGESGSGKSTLARCLMRLIEPDDGQIVVDGLDFAQLGGMELRRSRRLVQMVFQDPYGALNPHRTVRQTLVRAGQLADLSRIEAQKQAVSLLEMVGLGQDALDRRANAFSGGQRQRIGIARALALRPRILIADESVAALDASMQQQVLKILARLRREQDMTIIFITHDLRVALEIADNVAVMRHGQIVEYGKATSVLTAPAHDYTRILLAARPGQKLHRAGAAAC
ncbi:MAG: ABC transporter ATP-binding protein [Acetobacter sp.]|uniref:dipeptide ABC transporter ATP-binding protein n=1 Tax=Acetobacter sp. TaxID=440 RepID=UPI0039EAB2C7